MEKLFSLIDFIVNDDDNIQKYSAMNYSAFIDCLQAREGKLSELKELWQRNDFTQEYAELVKAECYADAMKDYIIAIFNYSSIYKNEIIIECRPVDNGYVISVDNGELCKDYDCPVGMSHLAHVVMKQILKDFDKFNGDEK